MIDVKKRNEIICKYTKPGFDKNISLPCALTTFLSKGFQDTRMSYCRIDHIKRPGLCIFERGVGVLYLVPKVLYINHCQIPKRQ